jgi:apolipoprotein N-acyltransferase
VRQIHSSAWLLVLLSAALQIIIFPLPGLYVLSWWALTPLIIAILRARPLGALKFADSVRLQPASPLQGFVLAYACGIVFYAGTCYWIFDTMRLYGGLNTPMALLVLFLFCCYLGLYHGFFGLLLALLAGSRNDRRALVIAPFLWVAIELARTRVTGFPWNLLGIAQVDNFALCRIAAWTGVYGISFEIALVNWLRRFWFHEPSVPLCSRRLSLRRLSCRLAGWLSLLLSKPITVPCWCKRIFQSPPTGRRSISSKR